MVCKNAILRLFNIGQKFANQAKEDPFKVHGLRGKMGSLSSKGKGNVEIYDSLHHFFTDLEKEGLPFATRIVREETGLTTRDDYLNTVTLPPHVSRYKCYEKWCFQRGWKAVKSCTAKNNYAKMSEFTPREHDDDELVPL